ncbi:hypothetical protein RvY_15314 [Ramazzottius varieornatus]|uniref:FLYWCH-type domain-containing protein n=1 Tax=Ramazzottius varieornatus TaxID=947166 RepID=A0A1D1VZ78_RAMVA|nr:hypothetical protein RvY_15314 [Ramazzottius varieornatus]
MANDSAVEIMEETNMPSITADTDSPTALEFIKSQKGESIVHAAHTYSTNRNLVNDLNCGKKKTFGCKGSLTLDSFDNTVTFYRTQSCGLHQRNEDGTNQSNSAGAGSDDRG